MRRYEYYLSVDEDQVDFLVSEIFWPIILDLKRLDGRISSINWLLSLTALKAFSEGCQHSYIIPEGAKWANLKSNDIDVVSWMKEAFEILEEVNPELEGIFTFNLKAPLPEKNIRQCIQKLDLCKFDASICNEPDSAYSPLALAIEGIFWRYFKNDPNHYTDMLVAYLQTRVLGIVYEEVYDPTSVAYEDIEDIYDPAAGIGMSLLECAKGLRNKTIRIEGQELDEGTRACAMFNLILHGFCNSHIRGGDVITQPKWTNKDGIKKYKAAVADLSSGIGDWNQEFAVSDPYSRFSMGVPGASNSDMALFLHCLASLSDTGKAAIIVQPGILYRGGMETKIRKSIVEQDIIETVITLPSQLYPGQTFQPSIVVINKNKPEAHKGMIKFIYAAEYYHDEADGTRSLGEDFIADLDTMSEEDAIVSLQEVAANEFNLNPRLYLGETDYYKTKIDAVLVKPRMYLHDTSQPKVMLREISELWRGMNPKNDSRISPSFQTRKVNSKLVNIINLVNVQDGKLNGFFELMQLTDKELIRARRYMVQKNDIIVSSRGTVLKVAIIPEVSEGEYVLSNNFICIRLLKGFDPLFVKAFLESPLGLYFLEASRFGATVQSLTVEQLGKIMIPDFTLNEQKKIALQLSKIEDAYLEAINKAKSVYVEGYESLYERMKIDQFLEPI